MIYHEIYVWKRKNKGSEDQQMINDIFKKSLPDFSQAPKQAQAD